MSSDSEMICFYDNAQNPQNSMYGFVLEDSK